MILRCCAALLSAATLDLLGTPEPLWSLEVFLISAPSLAQHTHLSPRRCAPYFGRPQTRTPFSFAATVSIAIAEALRVACKDQPQRLQRVAHDHLSSPFHPVGAFFVRCGSPLGHAINGSSSDQRKNVSSASATRSCSSAGSSRTTATTSSSRLVIRKLYHGLVRRLRAAANFPATRDWVCVRVAFGRSMRIDPMRSTTSSRLAPLMRAWRKRSRWICSSLGSMLWCWRSQERVGMSQLLPRNPATAKPTLGSIRGRGYATRGPFIARSGNRAYNAGICARDALFCQMLALFLQCATWASQQRMLERPAARSSARQMNLTPNPRGVLRTTFAR